MKTGRAILSGVMIWFLVLALFGVLEFFPAVNQSLVMQGVIAGVLIIPFALLGASVYYKTGDRSDGLIVGLVMVITALVLDVLITVPLIEQPYHGTNHRQFFTNPLLWIIAGEDLIVIWLYYKVMVARARISKSKIIN